MTHDSDYGYINTFIEFLRQIIDIIKDLFSGVSTKGETKGE